MVSVCSRDWERESGHGLRSDPWSVSGLGVNPWVRVESGVLDQGRGQGLGRVSGSRVWYLGRSRVGVGSRVSCWGTEVGPVLG